MDQEEQEAWEATRTKANGRTGEYGQTPSRGRLYRKLVPTSRICRWLGLTQLFAEDLEGLKVGHDFGELGEGEDRILTLKDSRILDNEGDTLYCFVSPTLTEFYHRGRVTKRGNGRAWTDQKEKWAENKEARLYRIWWRGVHRWTGGNEKGYTGQIWRRFRRRTRNCEFFLRMVMGSSSLWIRASA